MGAKAIFLQPPGIAEKSMNHAGSRLTPASDFESGVYASSTTPASF
jgi:hypothetical protein